MVPDLLIENFKTHGFDVELLCPLQVFEVELNTDEFPTNRAWIRSIKSSRASSIVSQQLRRSLITGNAQNGKIKTTLDTGC